jgi:hypothetical protein
MTPVLTGPTCEATTEVTWGDDASEPVHLICGHVPDHKGLHWDPIDNINWEKAETL